MGPSSLDRSRALGAYGATIGLCLSNSAVPVRRTPAAADLQRDRDAQDQTGGGSDPPRVNDDRKSESSPERGDQEAYSPRDMQDPPSDPAREDRADDRPSIPAATEQVESASADRDRHVHAASLRSDRGRVAGVDGVCQTKLPSSSARRHREEATLVQRPG